MNSSLKKRRRKLFHRLNKFLPNKLEFMTNHICFTDNDESMRQRPAMDISLSISVCFYLPLVSASLRFRKKVSPLITISGRPSLPFGMPTHTQLVFWLKSYNLTGQIIYHFRWISLRIVGINLFQLNGTLQKDSKEKKMIEECEIQKKKEKKRKKDKNARSGKCIERFFSHSSFHLSNCENVCMRFVTVSWKLLEQSSSKKEKKIYGKKKQVFEIYWLTDL